jgi:signal transduction histidine kinase
VWGLTHLRIPWGEWLSIELAVLDYNPERRGLYSYRLDDDWVELGARREITFSSLAPGVHEFSAKGRNSQGVWSGATQTLRIDVIPPFWMTLWFRGVVLFAVAGLAIVGHRVRMKGVNKRNRELVALYEQREKARNELGLAYERLRGLTRRLEAAKEEERRHIARELHDEMGPALTAVIINLQLLSETREPERATGRIADTIEVVDRLVERIRDLSLDLRPPLLDELGLMPALRAYLEAQAERSGLDIEIRGDAASDGLPPELEIAAFRVVQEAVTNVIRHAQAGRVKVDVSRADGSLLVAVQDDGRGYDVRATLDAGAGRALGLLGMQERVGMLGGEVHFESMPGRGSAVRARIPVAAES